MTNPFKRKPTPPTLTENIVPPPPRTGWLNAARTDHAVFVFGCDWLDARQVAVCAGIAREEAERIIRSEPSSRGVHIRWDHAMRVLYPEDYAEYRGRTPEVREETEPQDVQPARPPKPIPLYDKYNTETWRLRFGGGKVAQA